MTILTLLIISLLPAVLVVLTLLLVGYYVWLVDIKRRDRVRSKGSPPKDILASDIIGRQFVWMFKPTAGSS